MPLIIGARKGFPNFNEFSMQTRIYISRLLEFRRAMGDPIVQPSRPDQPDVCAGNQQHFWFGSLEFLSHELSRDLQLVTSVSMTAIMTKRLARRISYSAIELSLARCYPSLQIPGAAGQLSIVAPASFILPWETPTAFPSFRIPLMSTRRLGSCRRTHLFPLATVSMSRTGGSICIPGFCLCWWTRVRTELWTNVNLNHWESTLDITAMLAQGSTALTNPLDYLNPANEWLTNRLAIPLHPMSRRTGF